MRAFCTPCNMSKDVSEFHPAGGSRRDYQSKCKACQKKEAAARYVRDREKILARTAVYAKANPHVPKAAAARYLAANIDAVRERNRMQRHLKPDVFKERDARFARDNKAKIAAKSARRRALKIKATPAWADPTEILAFYELAETISEVKGEVHHVDHIVPLNSPIVCGLHCPANFCILSGALNSSKGNRYWPDMPAPLN